MAVVRISASKAPTQREQLDPVSRYLESIGKIRLLTVEEEQFYGKRVFRWQHLLELMPEDSTESEWALAVDLDPLELQRAIELGKQAKQKLIEGNLRLVVHVARKYQHRGLELLELVQEGSLGLNRAVEKFDPSKGRKFSTYAYWWIRQSILRGIQKRSRSIKLPARIIERSNKLRGAIRRLRERGQYDPSKSDIAAELGWGVDELLALEMHFIEPTSLDRTVRGEGESFCLADTIASKEPAPEEYVFAREFAALTQAGLDIWLDPRERHILGLKYGFQTEPLTQKEICQREGLSSETVRCIERGALQKLIQPSRKRLLTGLLKQV